MYMIDLAVKYFSVVYLSIYYEKLTTKTRIQRSNIFRKEVDLLSVRNNL